MAPKRNSLLEIPPAASSDDEEIGSDEEEEDEEEVEGQGEEEDSDDDEKSDSDDLDISTKKPDPLAPTSQSHSSDDDDENESDSDDLDKSPKKPKPSEPHRSSNPSSLKPVKPLHDSPKPKKTVSKPAASTATFAPAKPTSTAAKRPLESDKAEKDAKRKKKKVGGGNADDADDDDEEDDNHPEEAEKKTNDNPKNIFQRVWSDEDEIVILKYMSDCKKQGFDASSDLQEFLDAIKKSLHVNVSREQLTNKIRRLKKKFQNNFKRGKSGEDPVFSKPHDTRSYELMKEIWGEEEAKGKRGAETNNGGNDLANGKRSRSTKYRAAPVSPKPKTVALNDISHKEQRKLEEKNWSLYPCLNESLQLNKNLTTMGESLWKEGLGLLGDLKTKELEQKWRKLQAAELEVYLKRVELVREQTMEVLKAFNSSDS